MISPKKHTEEELKAIFQENERTNPDSEQDDSVLVLKRSAKYWPVPQSFSDKIPEPGEQGSFWEDREDRYHCGIDFYAPANSIVLAIESGMVLDKGIFTSEKEMPYWLKTYYLVIKTKNNIIFKYCELSDITVNIGDFVFAGQELGKVGVVINPEMLDYETPYYVREIVSKGTISMLHLELYKAPIFEVQPYIGGNYFGRRKPDSLINPFYYFNDLKKQK